MDNLLFRFGQATDLEVGQNNSNSSSMAMATTNNSNNNQTIQSASQAASNMGSTKFNTLYKNSDKLLKKQQQRRNEILSNRLCKRDRLIDSIRRLVSDIASDDDDEFNDQQRHTTSDDRMDQDDDTNYENRVSFSAGNNGKAINNINYRGLTENTNKIDYEESGNQDQAFANTSSSACAGSNTNSQSTSNTKQLSPPKHQQQQQQAGVVEDKKFRNKAMLSEWLVDKPTNFESDWVLKATPVGRRCLVFARKGETVAYSRTGQFIKAFQSSLPGGCHMNISHCRRQFAIVDCIYVQHANSFYLMDALAWNEHKLYESEASFRFYWLQSRYNECQEKFQLVNSRNESRFYCLNTYSASDQDILTALNNDPLIKGHNLQLDGLLFFHIRGPYVPGANPLVLWIKPEMANRVLNISSTS